MFNDILKGFKELTSKTALKTIGQSVGAVLVSKNLPGVIQYGANKLAGQNIDLSGPIPALSSAVLVSSYCYGKGWKTAGTTTLAYASAELIIPHWNKALAGAIDQPLVLPVSSGISAGVSNYVDGVSDGMETVSFPGADGQTVTRQLESVNQGDMGQDGLIRTLKPPGLSNYVGGDSLNDFVGADSLSDFVDSPSLRDRLIPNMGRSEFDALGMQFN